SSGNWGSGKSDAQVARWHSELMGHQDNDHMKYVDLRSNGFGSTEISCDKIKHSWIYIDKETKHPRAVDTISLLIKKGETSFFN
ncbi:MAG: hypothetical protein AAFY41_16935, partial [Bacteroidota bacterium]